MARRIDIQLGEVAKLSRQLRGLHGGERHHYMALLYLERRFGLSRDVALGQLAFSGQELGVSAPIITQFGIPRSSIHTEYPFCRLKNDHGLWEVVADSSLESRKSNKDPKKSELIKKNAQGGLSSPVYDLLRGQPELGLRLAQVLLEQHFSQSKHKAILKATGFESLSSGASASTSTT